jgi:hypothetical protein
MEDFYATLWTICQKKDYNFRDIVFIENAAKQLGVQISPVSTVKNLCADLLDEIPISPLLSLPPEIIIDHIIPELIDKPQSLANFCLTSKYARELCGSVPFRVPGVKKQYTVLQYANAALQKCILYQWLYYLIPRAAYGKEPLTLPPYMETTLSMNMDDPTNLYSLINRLNTNYSIHAPDFVCSKEQFTSRLMLPSPPIPLYGTKCPPRQGNDVLHVGKFDFETQIARKIAIIYDAMETETIARKQGFGQLFDLVTSADFKEDVIKRLKSRYIVEVGELYDSREIQRGLCSLLSFPEIVPMKYYMEFGAFGFSVYIDMVTPEEIENAFQRYFRSLM